jgi:hypothetical protein
MSNNKQTIKLYTQEQVKLMIDDAHNGVDGYYDILKNHNPIELPSDEEIHEMGKDVIIYNDTKRGWFIEGLKFMRDKIQGGNK